MSPLWRSRVYSQWEVGSRLSYAQQLSEYLPARWPAFKHPPQVGAEDVYAQVQLDVLLGRDLEATGARQNMVALAAHEMANDPSRSPNHKHSQATMRALLNRDYDRVSQLFAEQLRLGHSHWEQGSRYEAFYSRDVSALLLHGPEQIKTMCRDWHSRQWWSLQHCAYRGVVGRPGLRKKDLDKREDDLLAAYRGDDIDTSKHRWQSKGSRTAGGAPYACNVWLTLIARERGLLRGISTMRPMQKYPVAALDTEKGLLSYFDCPIEGLPGKEPGILAAVSLEDGLFGLKRKLWHVKRAPAAKWRFDPVEHEVRSA